MYAKTSGWKFDEKQFDNILKSLRTSINYKGKTVTLQWRNLADTTFTSNWSEHNQLAQNDIWYLLLQCTEKNRTPPVIFLPKGITRI